jgi:hypothetical protein
MLDRRFMKLDPSIVRGETYRLLSAVSPAWVILPHNDQQVNNSITPLMVSACSSTEASRCNVHLAAGRVRVRPG